jgi:hypothetical protein
MVVDFSLLIYGSLICLMDFFLVLVPELAVSLQSASALSSLLFSSPQHADCLPPFIILALIAS